MNKYPRLPILPNIIREKCQEMLSSGIKKKGSMTLYSGPRVPWVCHVRKRSEWPVKEEDDKHCSNLGVAAG